jgi:sugar lactone lactonase YvrE
MYQHSIRRVDAVTGIMTPFAGAGVCPGNTIYSCTGGHSGDGGPATQALLSYPDAVALDTAGNLYIASLGDLVVRKVDITTGIINTIAGGGIPADGVGDNGPATSAALGYPQAIAVDHAGNLFIADGGLDTIRRVDATTGIITTVAGNGTVGFNGDGIPAASAQLAYPTDVSVDGAGDLFIADIENCRIRKVDTSGIISTVAGSAGYPCAPSGGDGGPATSASLDYPVNVHVDSAGELFINEHNHIRKVDTHGIISTFAGTGIFGFSGDGGPATAAEIGGGAIDVDAAGDVLFVDAANVRVRKVDPSGIITTVAGGGVGDGLAATSAQPKHPRGLATDAAGNLYIADCGDNRVRRVDSSGVITSVAGTAAANHGPADSGPATSARLWCPAGLAFDGGGNLYIADLNNNRVRRVDTRGTITTYAGNGNSGGGVDGVKATSSPITWPNGLTMGPGGSLVIAESGFARVRQVNAQGIISTVAGNGIPGYSGDGGPGPIATLDNPTAVAYDSSGNLLIADNANRVIRSVAAGTPPPPPPVTKKTANCGMTVTQNLTLADDIGPCPGDGVIIGADGVHLNLNGHTISGTFGHNGNNVGVRATGRQKVDISGGTITGFDAGVAIIDGGGNTVRGLTLANNVGNSANFFNSTFGDGVVIFSSGGNTVAGNTVAGNGPFDGIAMIGFGADNNLIQQHGQGHDQRQPVVCPGARAGDRDEPLPGLRPSPKRLAVRQPDCGQRCQQQRQCGHLDGVQRGRRDPEQHRPAERVRERERVRRLPGQRHRRHPRATGRSAHQRDRREQPVDRQRDRWD